MAETMSQGTYTPETQTGKDPQAESIVRMLALCSEKQISSIYYFVLSLIGSKGEDDSLA